MRAINLIPPHQLSARLARRRARRWARLVAASALAGAIAIIGLRINAGGAHPDRQVIVARMEGEIASARERLTDAVEVSRALARRLRIADISASRPDWSRLVALIADRAEGLVILDRLAVEPDDAGARTVRLAGIARDAASPSRFALRLQETGLFLDVEVAHVSRRPVNGRAAIAFEVIGVLEEPREDQTEQAEGPS